MAPGPRRRTHSTILHRLNSILKRNPSLFHHLCLVRKSTILGHGLGHTMLTQTLRTLTTNVRCGCTQFAFQDSGLFGFNPWQSLRHLRPLLIKQRNLGNRTHGTNLGQRSLGMRTGCAGFSRGCRLLDIQLVHANLAHQIPSGARDDSCSCVMATYVVEARSRFSKNHAWLLQGPFE